MTPLRLHTPAGSDLPQPVARKPALPRSVHTTQPWRFRLIENGLELRADRSRQLAALDPAGRQLLISCGCALFNARVALAATGSLSDVHRLPDPADPDLLARLIAQPTSPA